MQLYDYPSAPNPRKVRLFVAEKGIVLPTVTVDMRARAQLQPDFLAKNPSGTLPLLELDDGTLITESVAICHYLEELYPSPNLLGADAEERALVRMWNDIQTFEGFQPIADVLRNTHPAFKGRAIAGSVSYEQIPALAERGRARAEAFFDRLDARLAASPFVALDRFTYADIVGFVYTGFAAQTFRADPCASRPNLERWRDSLAVRPAIASSK